MNLWQQLWTPVRIFLGLGASPETLTFLQISIRGAIVFIFTLIMVRLSAPAPSTVLPISRRQSAVVL